MADYLNTDTAIVGGGWAGLAAAITLADSGHPVHLYESARQLGGRARSVAWEGRTIDNGQHLMAGAYRETLGLMARLGTLDLLERRRLDLQAPGFRLALPALPAPLHLAIGLLAAQGLGLADKLAAARFMNTLKRHRFMLGEDCTAAMLLARYRQPRQLIERLWEPICVAALNTPLATASAQVFCNVLRDSLAGRREDGDMLFNRADLGKLLPEAAHAHLIERGCSIHLATRVASIRRDRDRFRLDGVDAEVGQVIVACHPAQVPALLSELEGAAGIAAMLRQFSWQPITTLWLRFAAPICLPYPMGALGHGTAPWVFERSDLEKGMVSIVASAEGPHLKLPAETLRKQWLQRLESLVGRLPPLLAWKLIIEKRATYACTPGLGRPGNTTPVPGLYLAGDYTAGDYPATLEGAVSSGMQCARLMLNPDAAGH